MEADLEGQLQDIQEIIGGEQGTGNCDLYWKFYTRRVLHYL